MKGFNRLPEDDDLLIAAPLPLAVLFLVEVGIGEEP
jgi:hypothetical protein